MGHTHTRHATRDGALLTTQSSPSACLTYKVGYYHPLRATVCPQHVTWKLCDGRLVGGQLVEHVLPDFDLDELVR